MVVEKLVFRKYFTVKKQRAARPHLPPAALRPRCHGVGRRAEAHCGPEGHEPRLRFPNYGLCREGFVHGHHDDPDRRYQCVFGRPVAPTAATLRRQPAPACKPSVAFAGVSRWRSSALVLDLVGSVEYRAASGEGGAGSAARATRVDSRWSRGGAERRGAARALLSTRRGLEGAVWPSARRFGALLGMLSWNNVDSRVVVVSGGDFGRGGA